MEKDGVAYKFVVALNKTLESGVAINAGVHMALGLVPLATDEQRQQMKFIDYKDGDQQLHRSISALPAIIMRGTNGDLKRFLKDVKEAGLLYVDFIETMTGGTYLDQLERTLHVSQENIIYYGVAVFGKKEVVDTLTKRLSLWK
jgi:hypothetical protein